MASCEIRKVLNAELLLRIERSQLRRFCLVTRMPQERLASHVGYTPRKNNAESYQGTGGIITSRFLFGSVLKMDIFTVPIGDHVGMKKTYVFTLV